MGLSVYNNLYKRTIDKSIIPTCNILGVNIAAIDMQWLVNFLKENISKLAGDYISVSNVCPTKKVPYSTRSHTYPGSLKKDHKLLL